MVRRSTLGVSFGSFAMVSLNQLLKSHAQVLLIDSASATVQIGLWQNGRLSSWRKNTGEAGEQIFTGVDEVLRQAAVTLQSVDAFVFCDGPGSVLGIRTAAVALRTWSVLRERPCYAFCGLSVVAEHWARIKGRRHFAVIADARRDSWHHVDVDAAGTLSELKRVPTASLSGDLLMPEGFRHWSTPPPVETVSYALERLLPPISDSPLFQPAPAPDAFLHEEPVYQTWTPQVHRAPSP
jgi:tRNA threonylcarbamoyladenosine biosynthesis protein TsaB